MTSAAPAATPNSNNNNHQQQQPQHQHANQPPPSQGPGAVQASTSPPSKRDLRTWWKNFKIPSKHQEAQGTSALPASSSPRRSASFFVEHFAAQSVGDLGSSRHPLSEESPLSEEVPVAPCDVPQASVETNLPPPTSSVEQSRWGISTSIFTWLLSCTPCSSYCKLRSESDQKITEPKPQGIFGVPLRQSITYANVAISLIDENGKSYIYGYVPIVVAKCGVFLKEKGT